MSEQKAKRNQQFASLLTSAFQNYTRGLHRYIAKRVRDSEDASDLTQDIFERLMQVPESETVNNPQGFVYGVASNVVREHWDRQGRSLVAFDSEAVHAASERLENAQPDDMAERLAMEQELRYALRQLPPVHRAVLLLVKREGLSYAEVAKRTDLEETTVKKYVFEARAKVKQLLKSAAKVKKD